MYAIETELGRFVADTEREAKAALRAAKRKQDALDAEANRKHVQARMRAAEQGYNIHERRLAGRSIPPGWRYKTIIGEPSSLECVMFTYRDHQRGYEIETEDGRASVFPYDDIVGYIENGAGYCMAVAIDKQDYELFAVGVFEGVAAWVPLSDVKIAEFRHVG